MVKRSGAAAHDGSARRLGVIDHGLSYDRSEIKLTVAVGVGTRKYEESSRRRIQKMRLRGWRMGARLLEAEVDPELFDAGKCRAEGQCRRAAATQPLGTVFRRGHLARTEFHDEDARAGSFGGAGFSGDASVTPLLSPLSPLWRAVVRPNLRCSFCCCRAFRDSSFWRLA